MSRLEDATDRREIATTRHFNVPRERVLRAFTEPEILAHWWGPEGFTNTFHEFDPRPGGAWKLVMHGPDGTDYDTVSRFVEVVEPERIVIEHLEPGHFFRLTVNLEEEGGSTRLTWRMRFDSPEEVERIREFIVPANEQNLDRLEGQLRNGLMNAGGAL